MKNKDYDAKGFAMTVRNLSSNLTQVEATLSRFSRELSDPQETYHPYATDHADETLRNLAAALDTISAGMTSLRKYTNYPSVPAP